MVQAVEEKPWVRGKERMPRKGEEAGGRKEGSQCVGGSSLCCEVPWGPARSGHHEVGTMMDILGTGLWGHLSI